MLRFFAGHPTAANLLMVLLLAVGLLALPNLKRETFPDFAANRAQVQAVWPGASAEEVEEGICQRLEEAVEGIEGVEEVRCEARESLGAMTLKIRSGRDVARFLSDLKTEVDAIDAFPQEVEAPVVRLLDLTDLVVSVAVAGPMSETALKAYADDVRLRLTRLPGVSQVNLQGFSQRQIRIELDAVALRQLGLSAGEVATVVERQAVDLPSGLIETHDRDILVRFVEGRRSPRAFEDLVVRGAGTGGEVRLGQIATIVDGFARAEERVTFNGERAALLQVNKTRAQDTLTVRAAVERFVVAERERAPPGITIEPTFDVASIVQDRLDMLISNGLQGLALVFLVLWLFFSVRFAFWVTMALPVSFMAAFAAMVLIGYSINMITMVALLISIGLLMDDSIVLAENIASHFHRGKSALDAAVDGVREVGMGVVSSFLTSVAVFAPLAFVAGDMGRVLGVLPVVLILTLAVSLVEAFLILPHHLEGSLRAEEPNAFRRRFEAGFERLREVVAGALIDGAVRYRYLTLGLVAMAFLAAAALLAGGILKVRAFPELDGDLVQARIQMPQGTPLAATEVAVARAVAALGRVDAAFAPRQPEGEALVRNVLVQFSANADVPESGPHLATVTADLLAAQIRDAGIAEVLAAWREETGVIPDARSLTFKEPQMGPAGLPIDIWLKGEDLDELKVVAGELIDWLAGYRGVSDLTEDLSPGKPELRLSLRPGAMALGLDAGRIAGELRTALQGRTAAEIQVGREGFEIVVRLDPSDRDSLGDLDYFVITLPDGTPVPLSAVARIEEQRGPARILRVDRERTVTVRGDVDTRLANVNEILGHAAGAFLPGLTERHPGVTVVLEGAAAAQAETGSSLLRGFLFGLLGVFLLLALLLRSYVEPIIVMTAIPLGLIGVVGGHLLMGLELSMPSFMGFAALSGVVVNNSILLVLFIKGHAGAGLDVVDAARQAARDRFRPILLTSATTIAGLTPLLFERSLQAQVLVPLVASLAFGLITATFLVLVLLPALYAILHDLGLTTVARDGSDGHGAPRGRPGAAVAAT